MNELIDFSDCDEFHQSTKINNKIYKCEYDTTTTEFYRVMRERKLNVITHESINPEKSFKFPYQWDSYTGERNELDPFGPLYFHPDDIIHYFDVKKLDNLWIEPKDEAGGYYEGYYGDAVGSGDNILIKGRGLHPELYLFRLPIPNCYLPKKYDMSIITMGPVLTKDELKEIDRLANEHYKNNYIKTYNKSRPSLATMKQLYDEAISTKPNITAIMGNTKTTEKNLESIRERANRNAVDLLRKM